MPIILPTDRVSITEELNFEVGRVIEQGEGGNEVRRSICPAVSA